MCFALYECITELIGFGKINGNRTFCINLCINKFYNIKNIKT